MAHTSGVELRGEGGQPQGELAREVISDGRGRQFRRQQLLLGTHHGTPDGFLPSGRGRVIMNTLCAEVGRGKKIGLGYAVSSS